MRLTLVTSSFPVSPDKLYAQAPFLADFIDELTSQDVEVTVFTHAQPGAVDRVLPKVRVIRFPWAQSSKALALLNPLNPADAWRMASYLVQGRRHLLRHLREHPPHTMLALWAVPSGWLALEGSTRSGIPFGVWCLGSDIHQPARHVLGRAVLRRVLRGATWAWADGFGLADEVTALAGVPCGYLATARRLPRVPAGAPDQAPAPRWLFVGRLERVKGIDVLVDAMVAHLASGGAGSLTIVGDGSLGETVTQKVRAAGLSERIRLVGKVSDEGLAGWYANADAVVIPSRNESLPLVFGEALAAGKPLVVTDVGDMGRLGRQYDVARVVPAGDVAALKAALAGGAAASAEAPGGEAPGGHSEGRLALLERLDVRRSAREVAVAMRGAVETSGASR